MVKENLKKRWCGERTRLGEKREREGERTTIFAVNSSLSSLLFFAFPLSVPVLGSSTRRTVISGLVSLQITSVYFLDQ